VDRDADVELLYELINSRQSFRCGVARDNHANTRSLAVFEFAPDVSVYIFREIDGPGSVKLDARRGIVRQRGLLSLWIHRKMIFDVLRVQREHIELLHEADHLRAAEVTKRVTGQAQSNRRCFLARWRLVCQ
jgi:hypothetical protein